MGGLVLVFVGLQASRGECMECTVRVRSALRVEVACFRRRAPAKSSVTRKQSGLAASDESTTAMLYVGR